MGAVFHTGRDPVLQLLQASSATDKASRNESAIELHARFTQPRNQRLRRPLATDAGQNGRSGLNARLLAGEECESERASAKRITSPTKTASDVKQIGKRAISTRGALQRQQPLQQRLHLPRSGRHGRSGLHARKPVATERKHENELALTAILLDNCVMVKQFNHDIATRSLAQQRSLQQQPKSLQNGPTGRPGLLARELAMLEHVRDRDTAKEHSAQV